MAVNEMTKSAEKAGSLPDHYKGIEKLKRRKCTE